MSKPLPSFVAWVIAAITFFGPVAAATTPAWLSLHPPHQGIVTFTAGVGTANVQLTYPERWSRLDSRITEQFHGVQIHLIPTDDSGHAFVIDTKITQARERGMLHTWTPDGARSVGFRRETGATPRMRLGWQYEGLSPLWRRGIGVGYTMHPASRDTPSPDFSTWLARVYEPTLLSIAATYQRRQAVTVKAGVEVVLNPRLAIATDIIWLNPTNQTTPARTTVDITATLREEAHTGWNIGVNLGQQALGIRLGRTMPLR